MMAHIMKSVESKGSAIHTPMYGYSRRTTGRSGSEANVGVEQVEVGEADVLRHTLARALLRELRWQLVGRILPGRLWQTRAGVHLRWRHTQGEGGRGWAGKGHLLALRECEELVDHVVVL